MTLLGPRRECSKVGWGSGKLYSKKVLGPFQGLGSFCASYSPGNALSQLESIGKCECMSEWFIWFICSVKNG